MYIYIYVKSIYIYKLVFDKNRLINILKSIRFK